MDNSSRRVLENAYRRRARLTARIKCSEPGSLTWQRARRELQDVEDRIRSAEWVIGWRWNGTRWVNNRVYFVQTVVYKNGSFWISHTRWQDPVAACGPARAGWVWVGAPRWHASNHLRDVYNILARMVDLTGWHEGEYIECEEFEIVV